LDGSRAVHDVPGQRRRRAHGRESSARLLTTGERGAGTVSTDGEDLKVETFVKP
jgi:hypothetical protein